MVEFIHADDRDIQVIPISPVASGYLGPCTLVRLLLSRAQLIGPAAPSNRIRSVPGKHVFAEQIPADVCTRPGGAAGAADGPAAVGEPPPARSGCRVQST